MSNIIPEESAVERFVRYVDETGPIYDSSHSPAHAEEPYYYEIPESIVVGIVDAIKQWRKQP